MLETILTFLIVVLFPIAWYAVQYGILELAKLGFLWDIVPEGFARAYVRMGKLSKMGLSYSGFEFQNELPEDAPRETDNLGVYKIIHSENSKAIPKMSERVLDILLPARGVVWKGFPGFYQTHTVEKLTWIDDSFQNRVAENVTEVLVRSYAYGLKMDKVELEGTLEFNFKFLVTLQVTNPALAWFRINRYLDVVLGGMKILVIKNFKGLSWTDIVGKTKKDSQIGTSATGPLEHALAEILSATSDFEGLYGVKVHEIGIYDFEAASDETRLAITSEEVSALKAKAEVAEAEGQARIIKINADAKADATRTEAKAEADAITAINAAAESMGPNALRLKELHTIEHAGANVTLIGNTLTIPAVFPINTSKGG